MKVADLLRAMISMVDAAEQESAPAQSQPPVIVNVSTAPQAAPEADPAVSEPAHALTPVNVSNNSDSEPGVFVPPLQQKIELLKKSVGVDNVFDNNEEDELEKVKRHAGIAAKQEMADDEPLDV
jgi:hypothetical protein